MQAMAAGFADDAGEAKPARLGSAGSDTTDGGGEGGGFVIKFAACFFAEVFHGDQLGWATGLNSHERCCYSDSFPAITIAEEVVSRSFSMPV